MIFRTPIIWLLLILLTLASYVLIESSTLPWISAIILSFTVFKAWLIIDGFMELRGHSHLLRRAMNLYCPILASVIWFVLQ